jgi:hypothetical protein
MVRNRSGVIIITSWPSAASSRRVSVSVRTTPLT